MTLPLTPPRPHDDPFLAPAWEPWVFDPYAPQWAENQSPEPDTERATR